MDDVLESLRPRSKKRIMDLVEATGIDVADWANYKGRSPSANPRHCYDWVFRDDRTMTVCLWFDDIQSDGSGILRYRLNPRGYAESLRTQSGRAGVIGRARALDEALHDAWLQGRSFRVIVVHGKRADRTKDPKRSSRVDSRLLDPMPWHVAEYDVASGMTLLLRAPAKPRFVDQFDIEHDAEAESGTRKRTVNVRDRSALVRASVLERACGRCEYCGCAGFLRPDGSVYLETHHIVPLHEGGPDSVRNVAALCPNHHREAHHGSSRGGIREALLRLAGAAPAPPPVPRDGSG